MRDSINFELTEAADHAGVDISVIAASKIGRFLGDFDVHVIQGENQCALFPQTILE